MGDPVAEYTSRIQRQVSLFLPVMINLGRLRVPDALLLHVFLCADATR